MAPCFVAPVGAAALGCSGFTTATCAARPLRAAAVPRRATLRMGLGEDGLAEDIEVARQCIEEGCEVDAVQAGKRKTTRLFVLRHAESTGCGLVQSVSMLTDFFLLRDAASRSCFVFQF
jgi:hypothetical protein